MQVLADFLVECIVREAKFEPQEVANTGPNSYLPAWTLHIYGSSKPEGGGAGLVLTGPNGVIAEYSLWFKFLSTNNEAEYEALMMELRIAMKLRVQRLKMFTDC